MPIPAQQPTVIPAVKKKTFSDLWLYNVNIHAPTTNSGRIYIEALPYNPTLQEIGPSSGLETISTDLLFEAVAAVPEVQAAYLAIIDAIAPLRTWINTRQNPVAPEIINELLPPPPEVIVPETVMTTEVIATVTEPTATYTVISNPQDVTVEDIVTDPGTI